MSVTLILADADLEALPATCGAEAARLRVCRMTDRELKGIHILDSYLHKALLEGVEGAERRGRPDIAHSFLLLAQSSQPNREGRLRFFVHTRGDEVIRFGRRVMIEQDYMAFLAMLSELFEKGSQGSGEERIQVETHMTLSELLRGIGPALTVVMSPIGEKVELSRVLKESLEKEVVVIIGGFPEGDYRSPAYELADRTVSLGDELLTVPDVTAQVLSSIP
jgi:rRNA small subunit pseudouridine methyltransferase Nep1